MCIFHKMYYTYFEGLFYREGRQVGMNEIQQLLASYNELEEEMIRFSTLVKEVMASITMQEFVPEKANTEMMQCIMELNTK